MGADFVSDFVGRGVTLSANGDCLAKAVCARLVGSVETNEVKTMRPELYQEVALTRDIPDENLPKGGVAYAGGLCAPPRWW